MIATLSGVVSEKLADVLVLDVAGVGYGLYTTRDDYARLVVGQQQKFYIHEHVREQSYDLFGFVTIQVQELFQLLLGVKNVGPKVALAVLDIGSIGLVKQAIAGGDVKQLQSAKGVGKRAAEQIVVELRDKVGLAASDTAEQVVSRSGVAAQDEAMQALVALGYSEYDAATALSSVDVALSTEERVMLALKVRG